jgi:hypothetical protein
MLSVTLSFNRKSIDFIPSHPYPFVGESFKFGVLIGEVLEN